ncbi:MAG: hypothetical protein IKZ53_06810 [Selenomonadaceae bacterium]|nr:hypothetical protein [Selenomonadaceae bacterium]
MTRQEAEKFLSKIGAELKVEQSTRLKKLESRAEEKLHGKEKFIELVTDVDDGENFSPIETGDSIFFANQPNFGEGEPKTLSYAPFFLLVPYEEFYSYLDKDFQGAGFTYRLKPNYRFVEAEKKLNRVARLYDVPLQIYSPYARRAVDICIFGEIKELDFKLPENNLTGKLLMNKNLNWNAAIDYIAWDSVSVNGKFYEYRCTAEDLSFVLPCADETLDDRLQIQRADGQIIFITPREFPLKKAERIEIFPAESKIASRILNKKRVRTQGDIEFVLSGLARDGYSCRFGNFGDAKGNISRYSEEHKYFSRLDENLLRAKNRLPVCTVKFKGAGIFLTDYANFVLKFLEENYPEFNWAGERDE